MRSRPRSPSPFQRNNKSRPHSYSRRKHWDMCDYHIKSGSRAGKCQPLCKYQQNRKNDTTSWKWRQTLLVKIIVVAYSVCGIAKINWSSLSTQQQQSASSHTRINQAFPVQTPSRKRFAHRNLRKQFSHIKYWHESRLHLVIHHSKSPNTYSRLRFLDILWSGSPHELQNPVGQYKMIFTGGSFRIVRRHNLGNVYFVTYTDYPIRAKEPRSSSSPIVLYGPTWTLMYESWFPSVWNVRSVKCTDTPNHQLAPSANPMPVSLTCMLT